MIYWRFLLSNNLIIKIGNYKADRLSDNNRRNRIEWECFCVIAEI